MAAIRFTSVEQLQRFRQLACSVPEEVWLRSWDGEHTVDAKSLINVFVLDFSQPVEVITDSRVVLDAVDAW